MENGLYIGKMADDGVKAVYFDQDNLEMARICRTTKARREAAEAEAKAAEAANKAVAAQAAKAARKARNRKRARNRAICRTVAQAGAAAAVAIAAWAGVPGSWIAAAVGAMALALVAYQVGRLAGK